VRDKWVKTARQ